VQKVEAAKAEAAKAEAEAEAAKVAVVTKAGKAEAVAKAETKQNAESDTAAQKEDIAAKAKREAEAAAKKAKEEAEAREKAAEDEAAAKASQAGSQREKRRAAAKAAKEAEAVAIRDEAEKEAEEEEASGNAAGASEVAVKKKKKRKKFVTASPATTTCSGAGLTRALVLQPTEFFVDLRNPDGASLRSKAAWIRSYVAWHDDETGQRIEASCDVEDIGSGYAIRRSRRVWSVVRCVSSIARSLCGHRRYSIEYQASQSGTIDIHVLVLVTELVSAPSDTAAAPTGAASVDEPPLPGVPDPSPPELGRTDTGLKRSKTDLAAETVTRELEVDGSPFRCTIIGADAGASSVSGEGLKHGIANSPSIFRACLLTKVCHFSSSAGRARARCALLALLHCVTALIQ
jgi:hypothetical protein